MVKTFDIVIAHYNAPSVDPLAVTCLRSIIQHSSDYRVIWVQNGAAIPDAIKAELDKCETHLIIRNEENQGFVKASNEGMRKSTAPYVVLLNNDTAVSAHWLTKLRIPLVGDVGISGPLSTANGSWQGRWIPRKDQPTYLIPRGKVLAFFCVMIRRDVIAKVGYLDEAFGLGLGDDDNYSHRAHAAGFRLALVQDLRVFHNHRSTFKALFSQTQIHDMQLRAFDKLTSQFRKAVRHGA
jgi:GT2 family glycosyltransferase